MNKTTLVLVLCISFQSHAVITQSNGSEFADCKVLRSPAQVAMMGRNIASLERSQTGYRLLMCGLMVTGGLCLLADLFPELSRDGNNSSVIFPAAVTTICVLRLIRDVVNSDY